MFLKKELLQNYKVEVKVMKTGNVILAIFLWLLIPLVFSLSLLGMIPLALGGADPSSAIFCVFGPSFILFIIGLLVLITGMEKPQPAPPKQVVTEIHHYYEPKNKDHQIQPIEEKIHKKSDQEQEQINFCYHCGKKIEGNPSYCYSCGAKVR
jgi:hypothetical protein